MSDKSELHQTTDMPTLGQRAVMAMASFPLPSQMDGVQENYRRILHWLYNGQGALTNAALVIDLSEAERHG